MLISHMHTTRRDSLGNAITQENNTIILQQVQPKVGAAKGCVGRGSGGPPHGKFCRKDTKSCILGLLNSVCSRVECSTTADEWQIYEYKSRKRSKSDAHMHRWILIFFLLRFCCDFGRTCCTSPDAPASGPSYRCGARRVSCKPFHCTGLCSSEAGARKSVKLHDGSSPGQACS